MIKLLITKNREKILNRAKGYYENNKKKIEKARNTYTELSNDKKEIKESMEEIDTIICLNKINKV